VWRVVSCSYFRYFRAHPGSAVLRLSAGPGSWPAALTRDVTRVEPEHRPAGDAVIASDRVADRSRRDAIEVRTRPDELPHHRRRHSQENAWVAGTLITVPPPNVNKRPPSVISDTGDPSGPGQPRLAP
jgi:hypothetical protein